MDIKAILKTAGVEGDKIEGLVSTFGAEIAKEFVKKVQYNKKVQELDTAKEQLNDYEALKDKPNEYKEKFETLQNEFNTYKTGIENEKAHSQKVDLVKSNLEKAGYTDKRIVNLMIKAFDVDKMEIENNVIKGWDELSKGVIEEYTDFKSEVKIDGASAGNPPVGNNVNLDGDLASAITDFYK